MKKQRTEAVAYLRVSSTGQAEGHGYQRQLDCITAWASRHGHLVEWSYQDAWTGDDADRPGFSEMVAEMLSNGCRTVLVESLDRLGRSVAVQIALLSRLKAEGISLISCATGESATDALDGDPMAEGMMLIQGVFAQMEKRRLVIRLARAREAKKLAGERYVGRLPYGHHEREKVVLALMRNMRMKHRGRHRWSFDRIADELNQQNILSRCGRIWRGSTIRRILDRAGYHD